LVAIAILAISAKALANPPAPLPNPGRPATAAQTKGAVAVAPPTAAAPTAAAPSVPPVSITVSSRETQYFALLDKAIEPVRKRELSVDDATLIRDTIHAIGSANLTRGNELGARISNPVGRKLVDWYRLRSGYGEPAEFTGFLQANPAWPDRTLLRQRLEEALFTQGGSVTAIKAAFASSEPQTGVGTAALASAFLANGETDRAKALAAKAWREMDLPASLEQGFLARFGPHLTEADHKWRLDRLLIDDLRWAVERSRRAETIRRLIPHLSAPEQKKATARLAGFLGAAGAREQVEALAKLPENAKDWGLVFQRASLLRRAKRGEEAANLVLAAPRDGDKLVAPDGWWSLRRASAYDALKAGKSKRAYELVRDAGPLTVNPLKEQQFMAGWIALRKLDDAAAAEPHFTAMRKAADGPLSRAKADYWLARTAEAKGDKSAAAEFYRLAAVEKDTFHGLLARQRLEPGTRPIEISSPAEPSSDEVERFGNLDAVQAVVIARKSSLEPAVTRAFITHLRGYMKSEAEVAMVLHLAEAIGDTQLALRGAKLGVARGHDVLYYAYPVHPFPAYKPLRNPPETALLLGIARQESEFNTSTVSGAGAKGLLQVMTVTAKHVCQDYKIKCEIGRLLTDKPYNTMIASAYIADRMDEFSGSYVLSLAGYNAGPGRAREWIKEFGDPRDANVDPVDWIERIPFQETREYVAKVLSNIQIYRARIGQGTTALRLEEDLVRGRNATRRAAPQSQPPKSVAKSDG